MTSRRSRATAALAAAGIAVAIMGASPARADSHSDGGIPFQVPATVNNPCAVFNAPTATPTITRITYGEQVNLLVDGTVKARIETERGVQRLKFEVDARGTGTGATSGLVAMVTRSPATRSDRSLETMAGTASKSDAP